MKDKYLWYSDLHLDKKNPWAKYSFIRHIQKENPTGLFLTGDISNGLMIDHHLSLLARFISCPIYFVLGNHDYWFSSFEKTHDKIRKLCKKYSNLIWMTENDIVHLTPNAAVIGAEGWYDAKFNNHKYLKATFDWILIKDFKDLPDWDKRVELFRKKSQESCDILIDKIEKCIEQKCKNIYLLSHYPAWQDVNNVQGYFNKLIFKNYNVNHLLGLELEKTMSLHKKKHLICLMGHSHVPATTLISRNIECRVGASLDDKNYGETFFI